MRRTLTKQLIERVHSKTHFQVRDLEIACHGRCVRVTGTSRTYYVKQLATQAIQAACPGLQLENEISVLAS